MHRNPHQSVTRPRPHRYDFCNVNITVLSHLRWINKRIVHTLLISKPYPTITLISNLTKSKLGQYTEQAMDPCCKGFTIISRPVAFSLFPNTHISFMHYYLRGKVSPNYTDERICWFRALCALRNLSFTGTCYRRTDKTKSFTTQTGTYLQLVTSAG